MGTCAWSEDTCSFPWYVAAAHCGTDTLWDESGSTGDGTWAAWPMAMPYMEWLYQPTRLLQFQASVRIQITCVCGDPEWETSLVFRHSHAVASRACTGSSQERQRLALWIWKKSQGLRTACMMRLGFLGPLAFWETRLLLVPLKVVS